MEEAIKIFDYLPVSYKNPTEKEYVEFLWDAFLTNYNAGKYPFAFLSYHMLFMCFVYFEIWQIKENCTEDFQKAMIGFSKDMEKELLEAKTPFVLWQVNESTVFRFLKLIGLDNSDIGRFTKIVKERNDTAHSNGNIFYKNKESLEGKINEMLSCVESIQEKSKPIIEKAFHIFLIESQNPDEREFLDDESQIREIFVHGNYFSFEDIKIAQKMEEHDMLLAKQNGVCLGCGVTSFNDKSHYLAVDHNHETGEVRGLLCLKCNRILGLANDSPSILRALADYLEQSG